MTRLNNTFKNICVWALFFVAMAYMFPPTAKATPATDQYLCQKYKIRCDEKIPSEEYAPTMPILVDSSAICPYDVTCLAPTSCLFAMRTIDAAINGIMYKPTMDYFKALMQNIKDTQTVLDQDLTSLGNVLTNAQATQAHHNKNNADARALEQRNTQGAVLSHENMLTFQPSTELCKQLTAEEESQKLEFKAQAKQMALSSALTSYYSQAVPVADYGVYKEMFRFAPEEMLKDGKGQFIFSDAHGTADEEQKFLNTQYAYFRDHPVLAGPIAHAASQMFLESIIGPVLFARPTGQALNTSEGKIVAGEFDRILAARNLAKVSFEKMIAERKADAPSTEEAQSAELLKALFSAAGKTPDNNFPTVVSYRFFEEGLTDFFGRNLNEPARAETTRNMYTSVRKKIDFLTHQLQVITDNMRYRNQVDGVENYFAFRLKTMNDPLYKGMSSTQ